MLKKREQALSSPFALKMLLELLQIHPMDITIRHYSVETPLNPANKILQTNIYKFAQQSWRIQLAHMHQDFNRLSGKYTTDARNAGKTRTRTYRMITVCLTWTCMLRCLSRMTPRSMMPSGNAIGSEHTKLGPSLKPKEERGKCWQDHRFIIIPFQFVNHEPGFYIRRETFYQQDINVSFTRTERQKQLIIRVQLNTDCHQRTVE